MLRYFYRVNRPEAVLSPAVFNFHIKEKAGKSNRNILDMILRASLI